MERVSFDDFNFLDPAEKSKNLQEKNLVEEEKNQDLKVAVEVEVVVKVKV